VIARTPTLAEWPYRMVRLACDLCPRQGQYRKETLIERFGGERSDTRRAAPRCAVSAQERAGSGVLGVLRGSAETDSSMNPERFV
jgi:hypothetical protein